jgi:hypothetical protein
MTLTFFEPHAAFIQTESITIPDCSEVMQDCHRVMVTIHGRCWEIAKVKATMMTAEDRTYHHWVIDHKLFTRIIDSAVEFGPMAFYGIKVEA